VADYASYWRLPPPLLPRPLPLVRLGLVILMIVPGVLIAGVVASRHASLLRRLVEVIDLHSVDAGADQSAIWNGPSVRAGT
jgi:hypothetical protein